MLKKFKDAKLDFSFLKVWEIPVIETGFIDSINVKTSIRGSGKIGLGRGGFLVNQFQLLKTAFLLILLHLFLIPLLYIDKLLKFKLVKITAKKL